MPMNGSTLLIAVNTGTDVAPVYTVLPCQKAGEYALERETIDTSCKDTSDATNLPGRASRTLSVEYNPDAWPEIMVTPVGAGQIIRKAAEVGTQIKVAALQGEDIMETCTATITSYTIPMPEEESVTISIELAISGAMVPYVAP